MSKQEENWLMVAMLGFTWEDSQKVESQEDRDFLVDKAKKMKEWMLENKPPDQPMPPMMDI